MLNENFEIIASDEFNKWPFDFSEGFFCVKEKRENV